MAASPGARVTCARTYGISSTRDGAASESRPTSVPKRDTTPGASGGVGDQYARSPRRASSRVKLIPHTRAVPSGARS
ncbi:hypothetical protein [Roseisolibacter sp. H3M3-2]|uniref:hypothetical protein n=1 Tax=Roseisolibacter sp. H3M3-2 TaxID=3031323 RepID=UPI0023DADE84|nr:hypothetical protein [Roseisolibacter sp. H3M3-2]MDF1501648.1 hypothetical protein [Roseisolibacter sp. H3M3-2]